MKGQIAGLMRQAQQVQDKMKQVQDSLEQEIVEGQSGAGLVKITMTSGQVIEGRIGAATETSVLVDENTISFEDIKRAVLEIEFK